MIVVSRRSCLQFNLFLRLITVCFLQNWEKLFNFSYPELHYGIHQVYESLLSILSFGFRFQVQAKFLNFNHPQLALFPLDQFFISKRKLFFLCRKLLILVFLAETQGIACNYHSPASFNLMCKTKHSVSRVLEFWEQNYCFPNFSDLIFLILKVVFYSKYTHLVLFSNKIHTI